MHSRWTRRKLLRASSLLAGGLALSPQLSLAALERKFTWRNWAGNLSAEPRNITAPESEAAIAELLKSTSDSVRPIGSGHSWSGLVPTDGTMVTLDALMGVIDHDPDTLQAELWAGTKLFLLGSMLEEVDQAVLNMSDINYQSLGGALATSTHGTGKELGSMSAAITGMRLLTPGGDVVDCNRNTDEDLMRAGMNSLGCLGITTRFRLQNQASHRLLQRERLTTTEEALEQAEQMARDNQQWELFPMPNSNRTIVVTTNPIGEGDEVYLEEDPNAVLQLQEFLDASSWMPTAMQEALYGVVLDAAFGVPEDRIGPSYAVLAHIRSIPFAEMEYTVPAEHGIECVKEVLAAIKKNAPHVAFPLEYRYVKGDDSLIGMFSERDGCSISVHQFMTDPNWADYLAMVEPVFHKYQGRPHWGKWHSLKSKELQTLYPHWDKFKQLRAEIDPGGRMLNPYLRELLGIPQV